MKKSDIALSLITAAVMPLSAHAAYKVIDVTNGGSVSGKVSFSGKDPVANSYPIAKDTDTCGKGERLIDFVKVSNGALNDTVVYLSKVKEGKAFKAELKKPVLDQKKCEFSPFLGVMKDGDKMTIQNSDDVLHNIHTYELIGKARKTVFNISQPSDLKTLDKTVKLKRGTSMKMECDAHDFMHGFTFVAKNPYYAVVKPDGSYTIDNIPAGQYKIRAWHGTLGEKKGKVEISAGGKANADFAYKGK